MPFRTLSKFGRSKSKTRVKKKIDVMKDVPGMQTRSEVKNIYMSLLHNRRSVRTYTKKSVSERLVYELIEAATYAPSVGNTQPWEFIVVRDRTMKHHLMEACYGQEWMLEAPVFIIICINTRIASAMYKERGERLYGIQSVAASTENLLLAAEALGLGACWVGSFSETQISGLLQCTDYIRPCAVVTVGYPAEKPVVPRRHEVSHIVHLEKFGETYHYKNIKRAKRPLP